MNRAAWRWIVVRPLALDPLRTMLTVLGVALGVAVFVSVRLASHSALSSFSATVDAVAGKANLQVTGTSDGLDERWYPRVSAVPGVIAAAPVVQVEARARPGGPRLAGGTSIDEARSRWPETLLVLGVDVLREGPFAREQSSDRGSGIGGELFEPGAIAITRTLARRLGLGRGDTLAVLASGRPVPFVVRQVLSSPDLQQAMGGNVVIADIATVQDAFQRWGRIDRIDLLVAPGSRERVRETLRHRLPADLEVGLPQARTRQVENMVGAFQLNLAALSFIALLVSGFLIFDAVGMSVLRRRREIGILRALGVTRREATLLFLGEGCAVGLLGGALGLVLGTALGRLALRAVTRTLHDLYMVQVQAGLRLDARDYGVGLMLGIGVAWLAALGPALEAGRTAPQSVMRQAGWIEPQRVPLVRWALLSLVAFVAAVAVALWTVREGHAAGGFASAFLVVLGFALAAPALTERAHRLALLPARRLGIAAVLGARFLGDSVARTGVAVAALLVAVGMLVGLSTMVSSFRRTVDTWITQTIRGDLYIEPVGHRESLSATELPESWVTAARSLPGVAAVDTYRGTRIVYRGRLAFAAGVDLDVQRRFGRLQFLRGEARDALARARREGGVVVTESFARRHRVSAGDTLTLEVPAGRTRLPVFGVFYDYTTDAGAILMDRTLFERLWNTHRTESLALYLAPGADPEQVRRRFLLGIATGRVLSVTPNRELRRRVLTVFDQTFQITYALQLIAVLVAVLGVTTTLTALIAQRGRDLGTLRAVGALRRQVEAMVLVESALIGLIGSVLGCACGLALAWIMAYVIQREFFGWTIRLGVDPAQLLGTVALIVTAATLAGIVPARIAARRVAAEAMRFE